MPETILDRPMPQSRDAELAVLGSALVSETAFSRASRFLKASDFSFDTHKAVWAAMQSISERDEPIELITLKEELRRRGVLEAAGGSAGISGLLDPIPDAANVEKYAKIIKEKSELRQIIALGNRLMRDALEPAAKPAELLGEVEEQLGKQGHVEAGARSVKEIASDVLYEIEARREAKDWFTGIPTGLPSLDAQLLGWQRGALTLIGAYTSAGKTATGLDFGLKAAETGVNVLYVALEMTTQMLGFRLTANASSEKLYFVRTGNLSDAGLEKVRAGTEKLRRVGDRFAITDSAFDLRQIAALARDYQRRGKLDLLFVDYLQLVEGINDETRQREIDLIGKGLLRLAKQLNIAVVAFAQLNEGAVNREGHRPMLSDMRESRAINQHARTVLLLNRPWMFDKDNPDLRPCKTFLHVEKNSEGALGDISLHFNANFQRFEEGDCRPGCEYYKALNDDWGA